MNPFWKSKTGRLLVGGCGTQVGMVLGLVGVLAVVLFGAVCVSTTALTAGLSRMALAGAPTANTGAAAVPVSAPSGQIAQLVQEIDALVGEIEQIQTAGAPSGHAPALGEPVAVANRPGVPLYAGPDAGYRQVGAVAAGTALKIIGRTTDSSWWLVSTADGRYVWVAAEGVTTTHTGDAIPVVMVPSQLGQPAASGPAGAPSPTIPPLPTATPTPVLPPGTPTPTADQEREYVETLPVYRRIRASLMVPAASASISPDGSRIALTERIRLYTIGVEGGHTDIWFEDDDKMGPIGGAVWSPDGKYLAFVIGFKHKYCKPCRAVALLRMPDGVIKLLEPPGDMDTDMPRWTQDGRLLINVHPGEPADGVAYVYNIYGEKEPATGTYYLSSSHEGQKWYPWLPGRVWRAGVSERADSYNED